MNWKRLEIVSSGCWLQNTRSTSCAFQRMNIIKRNKNPKILEYWSPVRQENRWSVDIKRAKLKLDVLPDIMVTWHIGRIGLTSQYNYFCTYSLRNYCKCYNFMYFSLFDSIFQVVGQTEQLLNGCLRKIKTVNKVQKYQIYSSNTSGFFFTDESCGKVNRN